MALASLKGYGETLLATMLLLGVLGAWGDTADPLITVAELAVIGGLVVGSIIYGLGQLYAKTGLKVGAKSALVYFVLMLVLLAVRYLLFGPL